MSIIERYHNFLQEQDIRVIEELIYELLLDPYNIEIIIDETYDDLVLLSITEDTDTSIEITNIFNGLIINKHNIKEVLCYSGLITKFIEKEDINRLFDFKLKNLKFYSIEDGEVVRLFYYNNQWIVSTLYEINADIIKASESTAISIKNIFESSCRSINFDYTNLDKQYMYVFGLYHHLHRNVIKHEHNKIVHLETYNRLCEKVKLNIGLEITPENTFKNSLNLIQTCKYSKYTTPGFIIHNIENDKRYKILTDQFSYVQLLKGEETDPIKNFIALNRDDILNEYLLYFKDNEEFYRLLTQLFYKYVDYFYMSYINIKIHKQEKPAEQYRIHEKDIINEIHQVYIATRINTSKSTVLLVLKHYDEEKIKEILTTGSVSI